MNFGYSGRNVMMVIGDSIGNGFGSTAAIGSAGVRFLIDRAATAAGKAITFVGSQAGGTFTNNASETYLGTDVDTVRGLSQNARRSEMPEIIIFQPGTNNLGVGSLNQTTATLSPLYTTALNELFDYEAHLFPQGGSPLRAVLCAQLLRRTDSAPSDVRVVDWNTNVLPGIVAAQVALGRSVSVIDGSAVTSLTDGLHPNDAGYAQWLPGCLSALMPWLRNAN